MTDSDPRACSSFSASHFITVVGAKGGVGTTTVAINVAACLHRHTDVPVVFLDWDFAGSSAPVLLGVTARHTLQSLLGRPGLIDPYALMQSLTPSPCGISALINGFERWHRAALDQDRLDQVVRLAAKTTPIVVADLGRGTGEEGFPLLRHATAILVVTTPHIDSLIETARLLQRLRSEPALANHLSLVVNQASREDRSVIELAARHVNQTIDVILPCDKTRWQEAAERGQPLVMFAPSSAFVTGIERLAERLIDRTPNRRVTSRSSRLRLILTGLTNWGTQR